MTTLNCVNTNFNGKIQQNIFKEIIECKNDPYPCDAKADCKDVMYTFECTCQKGYTVEPDFTKLSNETCVGKL